MPVVTNQGLDATGPQWVVAQDAAQHPEECLCLSSALLNSGPATIPTQTPGGHSLLHAPGAGLPTPNLTAHPGSTSAVMVSRAQNPSGRHTCSCPPIGHALEPNPATRWLGVTSTSLARLSVESYSSTCLLTGPKATDSDADTETDPHLSPSPTDHCPKARLVSPGGDRIRAHLSPWELARQQPVPL